jgi:hypothetical protein
MSTLSRKDVEERNMVAKRIAAPPAIWFFMDYLPDTRLGSANSPIEKPGLVD